MEEEKKTKKTGYTRGDFLRPTIGDYVFLIVKGIGLTIFGLFFFVFMAIGFYGLSRYLFPVNPSDKFTNVTFQDMEAFRKIYEKAYFANDKENCSLKLTTLEKDRSERKLITIDLANDIEYVMYCDKNKMCFRTNDGEDYKIYAGLNSLLNPHNMYGFVYSCTQKYYKGE